MSNWIADHNRNTCPECKCPYCEYKIVEDDEGHEDIHWSCTSCGHGWWVEGSDA